MTRGLSTNVNLVTFINGRQLLSLSLLGQYVSQIYYEVKKLPHVHCGYENQF